MKISLWGLMQRLFPAFQFVNTNSIVFFRIKKAPRFAGLLLI